MISLVKRGDRVLPSVEFKSAPFAFRLSGFDVALFGVVDILYEMVFQVLRTYVYFASRKSCSRNIR